MYIALRILYLVMYTFASCLSDNNKAQKGTNGVSTNGVTANFISFDRGTFWVHLRILLVGQQQGLNVYVYIKCIY